jgi:hypothetical protein
MRQDSPENEIFDGTSWRVDHDKFFLLPLLLS